MLNNYTLIARVVEEITKLNIPLVVKGDIVIRSALNTSGISCSDIGSNLLELDWIGTKVTNRELDYLLGIVVRNISYDYKVEAGNDYFHVKDSRQENSGAFFFPISVSIRETVTTSTYVTDVGKVKFNGSSLTELLYDKVDRASKDRIVKIPKTFYTLYRMSYLSTYSYMPNYRMYGDFKALLNCKDSIEEEYNKLECLTANLSFNDMYNRVLVFLEPFISHSDTRLFWKGDSWLTPEEINRK